MANAVITNNGKNLLLKNFMGEIGYTHPSKINVGSSATTPSESDTSLYSEITSKTITSVIYDTANKRVKIRALLTTADANGYTLRECGLINSDVTPVQITRHVFNDISKTSNDEIVIELVYTVV